MALTVAQHSAQPTLGALSGFCDYQKLVGLKWSMLLGLSVEAALSRKLRKGERTLLLELHWPSHIIKHTNEPSQDNGSAVVASGSCRGIMPNGEMARQATHMRDVLLSQGCLAGQGTA